MTALPEWEVTADPPMVVEARDTQQAADERVRLDLESPADDDGDNRPALYVRPVDSDEPWTRVYPVFPELTPEDL